MAALIRLRGGLSTRHWRWQIGRGFVGFLALFSYFWAITLLPLATAVTLNYTSAIFLALYLALAGWRLSGGGCWPPSASACRPASCSAQAGKRIRLPAASSAWDQGCSPEWLIYYSVRELAPGENRRLARFSALFTGGVGGIRGFGRPSRIGIGWISPADRCWQEWRVSPPPPSWHDPRLHARQDPPWRRRGLQHGRFLQPVRLPCSGAKPCRHRLGLPWP